MFCGLTPGLRPGLMTAAATRLELGTWSSIGGFNTVAARLGFGAGSSRWFRHPRAGGIRCMEQHRWFQHRRAAGIGRVEWHRFSTPPLRGWDWVDAAASDKSLVVVFDLGRFRIEDFGVRRPGNYVRADGREPVSPLEQCWASPRDCDGWICRWLGDQFRLLANVPDHRRTF